jgi:hypothetical protein
MRQPLICGTPSLSVSAPMGVAAEYQQQGWDKQWQVVHVESSG